MFFDGGIWGGLYMNLENDLYIYINSINKIENKIENGHRKN